MTIKMRRRDHTGVRVGDRVLVDGGNFGQSWGTVEHICEDMTRCHVRFTKTGWLVVPISACRGGRQNEQAAAAEATKA